MKILITGGTGFIGSALIRQLIAETDHQVVNLDALTYAATPEALADCEGDPRYRFIHGDIADPACVNAVFAVDAPDWVVNLAAETHVDRSIDGPALFVRTNVVGTQVVLDAARTYWSALPKAERERFRVLHVSTDEVFGSLGGEGAFTESSPYRPSSPYAASKAASDHLVRAWHRTYGLPTLVTNCSNNYGPWQFPEKLIPLMITKALHGEPLPVYGRGLNIRDWLFVEDHARALRLVLKFGRPGETYNIGGGAEVPNIGVVEALCQALDRLAPRADGASYLEQISFVPDRPGHDFRYAVDTSKITRELGWQSLESFASGLERTVRWYLGERDWLDRARAQRYRGGRLGNPG